MFKVQFQNADGSWTPDYRRFDTYAAAMKRCQEYLARGTRAEVVPA